MIDTPGHDSYLMRLAHSLADTLSTPLNDSFVDLDVLAVDPRTFEVTGTSHYSQMVQAAPRRRHLDQASTDWIVLRNRLSTISSRNKRLIGGGLQQLSRWLDFRCIEGLAERVIFRELYPRGLTAVDDVDEVTLGVRQNDVACHRAVVNAKLARCNPVGRVAIKRRNDRPQSRDGLN